MEPHSLTPTRHRLNHPSFPDVTKTEYARGTILELETDGNPYYLEFANTCVVETDKGTFSGVPIFYHCKEGHYRDATATRESGYALVDAARAFQPGDEVKVAFNAGTPRCVVGFMEGGPRMCLDIFKMTVTTWQGYVQHFIHFQCSEQKVYASWDRRATNPDGTDLGLTHPGLMIFGGEVHSGTTGSSYVDWLIRVGPAMYLLQVASMLFPAPIDLIFRISAAPYSPELEASTIALGAARVLPSSSLQVQVVGDYRYPDFTEQGTFTSRMASTFSQLGAIRWCLNSSIEAQGH